MFDFHSHFSQSDSILNTSSLLPENYTPENEEKAFEKASWHIGEIGLDKRYADVMPLDKQAEVFGKMIARAKSLNLAVTIHCVRCTELTLEIIRRADYQPWKLLWHGFTGSKETAAELFRLNVLVSIGPKFRGNIKELAEANPNFVLETDYCGNDTDEYRELISGSYKKAAEQLGKSISWMEDHCNGLAEIFKN